MLYPSLAVGIPRCFLHGFYLPRSLPTEMFWDIPRAHKITTVYASLRRSLTQPLLGDACFLASTPQAGQKVLQLKKLV